MSPSTSRAPRVGLVLGAGGVVGQAFHAGVLGALAHDLGWDPRTAEVIVGTSAGSIAATALRLGVPALDLASATASLVPSEEGRAVLDALHLDGADLPPLDLRHLVRPWRLPSPRLVLRAARRPWAFRPAVAAMTLVPHGWVDLAEAARALAPFLPEDWPDGLRICAARADTGARTVFGAPGRPAVPLDRAVLASCAIPGYFKPVDVGGAPHFDGGVHSPTNADCIRDLDLDLVIVSSPMSAVHGRAPTPDAVLRWSSHRRLQRELRRIRATGAETVVFEPSPRVLAAMGIDAMAGDRGDRVVRESFLAAGSRLLTPRVAAALAPLRRHVDPEPASLRTP